MTVTLMVKIMSGIFIFIFGSVFASFYGVVICRVPRHQSIAFPGSHCFDCGHQLAWYENIPVLSYLMTKGKCRNCGAAIGRFSLIYEILGGLLPLLLFIHCLDIKEFIFKTVLLEIMFLLAGYDYENRSWNGSITADISAIVYIIMLLTH